MAQKSFRKHNFTMHTNIRSLHKLQYINFTHVPITINKYCKNIISYKPFEISRITHALMPLSLPRSLSTAQERSKCCMIITIMDLRGSYVTNVLSYFTTVRTYAYWSVLIGSWKIKKLFQLCKLCNGFYVILIIIITWTNFQD